MNYYAITDIQRDLILVALRIFQSHGYLDSHYSLLGLPKELREPLENNLPTDQDLNELCEVLNFPRNVGFVCYDHDLRDVFGGVHDTLEQAQSELEERLSNVIICPILLPDEDMEDGTMLEIADAVAKATEFADEHGLTIQDVVEALDVTVDTPQFDTVNEALSWAAQHIMQEESYQLDIEATLLENLQALVSRRRNPGRE